MTWVNGCYPVFRPLQHKYRRRSCVPCTNLGAEPYDFPGLTILKRRTSVSSSFFLAIPYSSPYSSSKAVWLSSNLLSVPIPRLARTFTSSLQSTAVNTSIENKTAAFSCLSIGGAEDCVHQKPAPHAPLAIQCQRAPPHAPPVSPTPSIRCGL